MARALRAEIFGADGLDVGVVGQQRSDLENLPEPESKALLQSIMDTFDAFMGVEPLPAEMVPGPFGRRSF